MTKPRSLGFRRVVPAALASLGWLAGCASPPENQLLARFFRAVASEDRTTMSGSSMVAFPGGPLVSWEVAEIGAETSGPYRIPELREEVTSGEARRDEQFQELYAFRQANREALDAVEAARERNPEAALPRRLGEVADAWEAFGAERRRLVRVVSETQLALEEERRRAGRSLQREAQVDYLAGTIRQKELLVRVVEEEAGPRDYRFSLIRYDLTNQFGNAVPSRWIIAAIEPAAPGE